MGPVYSRFSTHPPADTPSQPGKIYAKSLFRSILPATPLSPLFYADFRLSPLMFSIFYGGKYPLTTSRTNGKLDLLVEETVGDTLALRMLGGLEKLVLENAALKAILQTYHDKVPWRQHLAAMQTDPAVNAVIRHQFAELRAEVEAESDLAEALQRLLTVFPTNKDEN
jgi:hypothetical protein